jgi:hypothetical protein
LKKIAADAELQKRFDAAALSRRDAEQGTGNCWLPWRRGLGVKTI